MVQTFYIVFKGPGSKEHEETVVRSKIETVRWNLMNTTLLQRYDKAIIYKLIHNGEEKVYSHMGIMWFDKSNGHYFYRADKGEDRAVYAHGKLGPKW